MLEDFEAFPLISSGSSASCYASCENPIKTSGKQLQPCGHGSGEKLHGGSCSRESKEGQTLRRNMKFHHCFAFVVGSIVGAGIFITPSLVSQYTPNLFMSMVAWTLAGGIALLGALCYCEMVSVVNKTGASYIFILDCYGKAPGFIVNWTNALIFAPCDACILLITIGLYVCAPFFDDYNSVEYVWCSKLVGLICMVAIAGINCLGAKKSGVLQIIFIGIQIALFLAILGMAVYSATVRHTYTNLLPEVTFNNTLASLRRDFPALSIALFNALYCFDGYSTIAYIVEETVNPATTIPLVTFTAVPFVTFVYILVNVSCAAVLTHAEMASSKIVIADVVVRVGGKTFAYFMPFLVAVCVLPALSGVFYSLPRLIMSSAREGQFPRVFSLIHKERRTPVPAIVFLAFATTMLTLCNLSLQTMLQCCNISIWFEYAFAISTILVNRWKRPELKRTYRTWITTPIFMMVVPIVLFVMSFIEKPVSSVFIVLTMMLSLPVYYVFLHKRWLQNILPNNAITVLLTRHLPLVKCEFDESRED